MSVRYAESGAAQKTATLVRLFRSLQIANRGRWFVLAPTEGGLYSPRSPYLLNSLRKRKIRSRVRLSGHICHPSLIPQNSQPGSGSEAFLELGGKEKEGWGLAAREYHPRKRAPNMAPKLQPHPWSRQAKCWRHAPYPCTCEAEPPHQMVHPFRYSRRMYWSAFGQPIAFRFFQSHSSFWPVRYATLASRLCSINEPE